MVQVKGFVFSFLIVIIAFIVTAISAGILADLIVVWKKPVIGSSAAFVVVVSGYVTAPSHKQIASFLWLILGAIAAWVLSGNSYYPEDHTQAYQTTMIPLFATYLSGSVALLICLLWHNKKKHKTN